MSITGGMARAVARARAVGATALQVFVKNANQWSARPFAPGEVEQFRAAVSDAGLSRHTIAHASYLVNLASPDGALWKRSVEGLGVELARCEILGIGALVVHPGAHMGTGEEAGLERVVAALDRLTARGGAVSILLETTAGQGSCLGSTFEQLAFVLARARNAGRLGVCLDTCHALAAGYEFRDARAYGDTLRSIDRTVGLERVRAIHVNDSVTGLGSRRDRHAHIGRGAVGLEAFRLLLNDRRFREVPMVLETHKGDDLAEDRMNLGVLRSLVGL